MNKDIKNKIFNTCRFLSEGLGHRLTGTNNEKKAAEFIFNKLNSLHIDTKLENFMTPTSAWAIFQFIYLSFFLISIFFYPLVFVFKLFFIIIQVLLIFVFYNELNFKHTFIYKFFNHSNSQNIIAKISNKNAKKRIILVSHIDSATAGILFHPKIVNHLKTTLLISFYSFFLLLGISILNIFFQLIIIKLLLIVMGVFYFISFIISFHTEYFSQPVQGANDNASSVSINLALAEYFNKNRPKDIEINFLFTGAEEAGCIGIYEFLRKHHNEYDKNKDKFIILECTGIGNPVYLKSEGMLKKYFADSDILQVCKNIRQNSNNNISEQILKIGYTELEVIKNFNFNGITIGSAPDNPKTVPNWHQKTDTINNIQAETLYNVYNFIIRIINNLNNS